MYVGTHYNSYYNSRFVNSSSVYQRMGVNNNRNTNLLNSLSSLYGNKLNTGNVLGNSGVQYVQALKTGAADMKSALGDLTTGAAFRQKTAISSDTDAMTVEASSNRYYTSASQNLSVQIDQVAQGQENTGDALAASANAGLSGYQQFEIEINGKTTQVSFMAEAGDSNETIQKKMAEAINGKNIGVTASVKRDGSNSTLNIASKETGDDNKNRFAVRDVSGNAVARTGANKTTKTAQNAIYSVNGGAQRTSKTNKVDLGNGITATLKKAGDKAVTVSTGVDKKQAINKVKELAESYNKVYNAALGNAADDPKANRLFTKMLNNTQTYMSSLNRVGIEFDADGRMKVNEEKMNAAVEDGTLESFFTEDSRRNYGFGNQLDRLATDVSLNTSNYVSQSAFGNGAKGFDSSMYTASQMVRNTQYTGISMLLDMFW
ncbi:hypothetical protein LJC20_06650 [Eubacteriales bacterium OttesenSCG-928-M02]|nr:hypothetical protein [Eubacteriales bacterium OttesenSCG-928-M02]